MEEKLSILVVEDERNICSALRDFLEFKGFDVAEAADGLAARRIVGERDFDLIVLDLMLPGVSGEQLCREWRQGGLQTPIVMLTAKGQAVDRIAGLNSGADDYVTKPFSLEELLSRIRAVLRRTNPARAVGRTFRFGDLDVDVAALKVFRDGRPIAISCREAAIIQYFAANPGRVIGRREIYRQVWKEEMSSLGTRTTDMHIAKLRGKIEKNAAAPRIITTVRGGGYRYEAGPFEK